MKATCSNKSCYPGEVVVGYVDVERTYVIIIINTFNKNYPPINVSYIFVWDKDDFIDTCTVFVFFSCYCIRFRLFFFFKIPLEMQVFVWCIYEFFCALVMSQFYKNLFSFLIHFVETIY